MCHGGVCRVGWSTEVFDAHETRFTIFIDFGPRTPLAPDRLREKLQVQSVGEADCEYKAIYPRIIS